VLGPIVTLIYSRLLNDDLQDRLAEQAVVLLRAKDRLNAVAMPTTGATVASTLMVVGEDRAETSWWRWLVVTCALSWSLILTQLDQVKAQGREIAKSIVAAEAKGSSAHNFSRRHR
jgi:hypothetical protein